MDETEINIEPDTLDPKNCRQCIWYEVVTWIISLDDGAYEQ